MGSRLKVAGCLAAVTVVSFLYFAGLIDLKSVQGFRPPFSQRHNSNRCREKIYSRRSRHWLGARLDLGDHQKVARQSSSLTSASGDTRYLKVQDEEQYLQLRDALREALK